MHCFGKTYLCLSTGFHQGEMRKHEDLIMIQTPTAVKPHFDHYRLNINSVDVLLLDTALQSTESAERT